MSFKLLAIRPLEGCNPKFLKNLEENRIYQFYNDYEFQDFDGKIITNFENYKEVVFVKNKKTISDNFYSQKRNNFGENLPISISAIVGKNGSGKSALVELIYLAMYNLAVTEKIISKVDKQIYFKNEIEKKYNVLLLDDNLDIIKFVRSCVDKIISLDLNNILIYDDKNMTRTYVSTKNKLLKYIEIINIVLKRFFLNKDKNNILLQDINDKKFDCENVDEFYKSKTYNLRNFINEDSPKSFKSKVIYLENLKKINNLIVVLEEFVDNMSFIENNIFLEIFYSVGDKVIRISKNVEDNDNKFSFKMIEGKDYNFDDLKLNVGKFKYSKLFYNLVVNYSLYGLNSNETGKWIENLFHKNDGYQTPIVINPFRNEGVIDVNSESELVTDRLMYNMIVNKSLRQIVPTNSVKFLNVTRRNKSGITVRVNSLIYSTNKYYRKFVEALIKLYNSNSKLKFQEVIISDIKFIEQECLDYILKKLQKITKNYKIYKDYSFEINSENIEITQQNIDNIVKLIGLLQNDKSHIVNKILQALNFIFINRLDSTKDEIYKFYINKELREEILLKKEGIDFNDFSEIISNRSAKFEIEITNLLPPSIFFNDYTFENGSKFSFLSSGEKQQIFSNNSILYHLINLNSTFGNNFSHKYPNVNLILDEIELYAHPEMQRRYVKELLDGISKLKVLNIKSINILFVTHSPFILSDIPKQNVLFLEVDNVTKKSKSQDFRRMNTFGANITDLLADSFFITDGLMGNFAKTKIEETIKWINMEKYRKDSRLQDPYDINLTEYNSHKKIIELIDEPILKMKLAEMLAELREDNGFQKELAIKEIEFLKRKYEL